MHGLEHWWRVRHNGLLVAGSMGASRRVVTLLAIFHDSHRNDDGADRKHGPRAAAWLRNARDGRAACACTTTLETLRALTDAEFNSLYTACDLHTGTRHHDDPTVAACFVADRLDLSRVGYRPDPARMPAPAALVDDAFIDAAMERERKRLAWPGGRRSRRCRACGQCDLAGVARAPHSRTHDSTARDFLCGKRHGFRRCQRRATHF
jgi:uncharacterized protein